MRIHQLQESDLQNASLSHWLKNNDLLRISTQVAGVSSFTEQILERIWLGIERQLGKEKKDLVQKFGLESLHRFLGPDQIHALSQEVNAWANQCILPLLNRLLEDGLQVKQRFYISTLSVVRFYVPWDSFLQGEHLYRDSYYFDLRGHNPHLDSWFGFPADAVNVWVALGRCLETNGVLFYPEATKPPLPKNPDEPPKDWMLGVPIVVSSPAREILLFGGDVPHGTSVNRSDETRVSATFRLFLERPDKRTHFFFLYRHGGKRYEGPWGKRVSALFVLLLKYKALFLTRVIELAHRIKCVVRGTWRKRVGGGLPKKASVRSTQPAKPALATVAQSPRAKLGDIETVSASQCRVLLKSGWVTFQRYCPHRGADLSQGIFDGQHIRCAWHNVGFSLADGRPECLGIAALRIYGDEN